MHLGAVHPAVQTGRTIYRKAELGTAGQIYGELNRRIHFEIVCDDANLRALVGRTAGELPANADGRLDAVYGQMYFLLPSGTEFYSQMPLDHLAAAHIQPPKPSPNAPLPPIQALQAAFTSAADAPLIVALRHAGGEGADGHRGSAYLSTLQPDGTSLGDTLEEVDAEYNLYTRANEISNAYPANARPAPSAVYELLRFGRVINTANENLTPNDVPHWRHVRYPGGKAG
jgi:hydroxyethylthiazole kinase